MYPVFLKIIGAKPPACTLLPALRPEAYLCLRPTLMKAGFVNIFGRPNAGKSTLLNALVGEKLAIVSPKVQTTRHRIKAFLNRPGEYQVILSDTPGILEPKYKLHEKMMQAVKGALEDADIALLLADATENPELSDAIFSKLQLKVPAIVVLNKIDKTTPEKLAGIRGFYQARPYCRQVVTLSALQRANLDQLLSAILDLLPESPAFYPEEDLSDLPMRFFVAELVREKIYELYGEEIPYHTAVQVNEFNEKTSLTKIQADIIVQRETQKGIILGEKGRMIRSLGTLARKDIEAFIGKKVFLELFVKIRPGWRENELHLREFGYS